MKHYVAYSWCDENLIAVRDTGTPEAIHTCFGIRDGSDEQQVLTWLEMSCKQKQTAHMQMVMAL